MSIGANILAPWVNDRARMFDYLVRLNPQMVVVCDEPSVAAAIKSALPNTTVIHRWVVDGDGSHGNWTPDAWIRSFALPLPPGVMGYLLNEPGGNWRELSAWLVTVMSLCAALNIPLCVGNFSKGTPPEAVIEAGELDALLLAFNDFPLHRFGYHPYWTDDPDTDEHANWHVHIQRRAAKIGAKVRLFATESGRDERGAYSDGYHAHMPSAVFAEKETRHAATLRAAGVPVAPYCYGKGGPEVVNGKERFKWEQFDWQDDAVVQTAFLAFNQTGEVNEMVVPGYVQARTKQAGVNVRVRLGPGLKHAAVTTVKTGDWVKRLPGSTISADGYTWAAIAVDKSADSHLHGWCALEVIWVGD